MKRSYVKYYPFDYLLKTIIIGDSGVGKSNLLLRFGSNKFAYNYVMTIGINFIYKVLTVDDARLKMQIWDTAGQDKFKTITQSYYNGSNGVLIVYAVDSKVSFDSVRNWIQDLKEKVKSNCQMVIVANKCDVENPEVTEKEGRYLAEKYKVPFFSCSAKDGTNVQEAFMGLAKLMKKNIIDEKEEEIPYKKLILRKDSKKSRWKSCSC